MIVACLFALLVGSAAAQEVPVGDEYARELFVSGSSLYEEGRYREAIDAWEAGYSLSRRPLFLFNIANAYERLGDLRQAIHSLESYRSLAPLLERETLTRRIDTLSERWSQESPRRRLRLLPAASLMVAGTSAVVGTAFGVSALRSRREAQELCVSGLCSDVARPVVVKERRQVVTADVAFAVSAAALSVGVVSLAYGGATVSVAPTGVMIRGRL